MRQHRISFLITQEELPIPRGDPPGDILWRDPRPFCHPVCVYDSNAQNEAGTP
jgi:hypothetical protein